MIFVQVEYMIQYINFLTEIIGQLSIIDMILIIALITFIILIISVIYLYKISTMEIEDEEESEVNDMMDLKEISRQIEENHIMENIIYNELIIPCVLIMMMKMILLVS